MRLHQPFLQDCKREDCRIQYLGSSTTLVGWTPTYDKWGKQLSEDPNTTTTNIVCNTCGKKWIQKQRGRDITTEEVKTQDPQLLVD